MSIKNNTTSLQELLEAVNNLPDAGSGEQATPVISVGSDGLITATVGTKTSTHQLAFQPAKTITPSTASQIAVSSGYYTGGNIVVDAIPSQYVVPSGTLTISANGTHDVKNYASAVVNIESGGSGEQAEWFANEDAMVTRTLSSYFNDRVKSIGNYAFFRCTNLTAVSFPAVTTIGVSAFFYCSGLTTASFPAATTINGYAFTNCRRLTTASFPAATTIGNYAFSNCDNLTAVNFPDVTTIGSSAFYNCTNLTAVSFPAVTTIGSFAFHTCTNLTAVSLPAVTTIGNFAFSYCYNLKSLYLTGSSLCKLSNSNAFTSTPIGGYSASAGTYGSIYVPASLLTSYQTATNWTYFSSRFVGI